MTVWLIRFRIHEGQTPIDRMRIIKGAMMRISRKLMSDNFPLHDSLRGPCKTSFKAFST
jgi:hypothetical protein